MERKLGINCHCLNDVPSVEALDQIKAVGFDMFFSDPISDPKIACELKEKAEKLGLEFGSIHAPFSGINDFWRPSLDYLALYRSIEANIDAAAASGVNLVVAHVSSGWNPPPVVDVGFDRFDRLVEYAVRKNVRIAFENIRKLGNISALMERYAKIPEVGFCFDCGHEHCYLETVPFLDLFGKRTFCTHIHDNWGRDKEDPMKDADYHLLPFDGTYDYEAMMRRLDKYNYQGALTLEVSKGTRYAEMSDEAFLTTCYDRIKKISLM
ncbi:MAG: sugar phosphate isomerase/epimerase [Ruminococcaceae bacterium]|nr:sugar phosphate isomerase/epimerase [Oscillospiraceae bacterium]